MLNGILLWQWHHIHTRMRVHRERVASETIQNLLSPRPTNTGAGGKTVKLKYSLVGMVVYMCMETFWA